MKRCTIAFSLLLLGLVGACSKGNDAAPAPAASASAAAPAPKPVSDAAAPAASASAAATGGSWSGKYSAVPGPFTTPDGGEWAGLKFRGEDASVGLGDGTLSVTIDPNGHAQGTLEGALGPLQINGELAAGEWSAALTSTDAVAGFSGTAIGKVEGDKITGTMHLSLPRGNVLREASFVLERKR